MAKPEERKRARELRQQGWAIHEIAKELNKHKDVIIGWCGDIELSNEQIAALAVDNPYWAQQYKGAQSNRFKALRQRQQYQEEGRMKAREKSWLHLTGCLLYWAEGGKSRKEVAFANSDPNMIQIFVRFLREEMGIDDEIIKVKIICHTQDENEIQGIRNFWQELLNLPETCLEKVQHKQGSNNRKNRLIHGVCTIRVYRVGIVQHIYGAIQEYGGFVNEEWLY
jgi:hypothetical protein